MNNYSLDTLSSARRARISARDRRHAAVHEAGHYVIAKYLGLCNVQAEIWKIEPRDYTEKEWVGSARCLMEDVLASKRMMVAVAGVVAEACWDKETSDELYIALDEFPEKMSQSDWDLSGCSPDEVPEQFWDATDQVFELLNRDTGKLWNALLTVSRRLIERSRLVAEHSMLPEPSGFAR